jgi:hypothetical protein
MFKKITIALVLLAVVAMYNTSTTYSWGFFGHTRINRLAVFTLPPEMLSFYKSNIEFITEHAVDPDKRRYAAEGEAPRHYIDIDHYAHDGGDPFAVMPRKWKDAVAMYTEDTLQAYGIVPWHLDHMVGRLTRAMKEGNYDRILRLSADLGHYVGDSHVPLHTTENYNGQMTNQKGIHGFWESRLPELISEDYDFLIGRAEYVPYILDHAWEVVAQSFGAVDSVLSFERILNDEFPSDQKYSYEQRGSVLVKAYSEAYSNEYHKRLNGMVERRMRGAVFTTGSYWYTAWVNAGQPDLNRLALGEISEEYRKQLEEEGKLFGGGKINGRKHDQ